jgi:prepilin peptidase CpaA
MPVAIWLTLGACLVAAYLDIRRRRIPNWLTASLAIAAIAVHAFSGIRAVGESIAVMAVLTALGTLLYSRGGIGGGDIKLAIAASGMVSFPLCIPFLLYTAIGGGLLAIVFVIVRGGARASFSRAIMLTASSGAQGLSVEKSETLPYAVAFAFGATMVVLAQSVAPFLRLVQL